MTNAMNRAAFGRFIKSSLPFFGSYLPISKGNEKLNSSRGAFSAFRDNKNAAVQFGSGWSPAATSNLNVIA